jgi:hypothetical protein
LSAGRSRIAHWSLRPGRPDRAHGPFRPLVSLRSLVPLGALGPGGACRSFGSGVALWALSAGGASRSRHAGRALGPHWPLRTGWSRGSVLAHRALRADGAHRSLWTYRSAWSHGPALATARRRTTCCGGWGSGCGSHSRGGDRRLRGRRQPTRASKEDDCNEEAGDAEDTDETARDWEQRFSPSRNRRSHS